MGSFSASLKTIGDTRGLPATVSLEEGRLSIIAGDAPIGEWPLADIGLEAVPTGYRLAAEGEHLIIEMSNSEQFAEELARATPKKRGLTGLLHRKSEETEPVVQSKPEPQPEPRPERAPQPPERRGLPGASVLEGTERPRPSKSTAGLVSRFRSPKTDKPEAKPERRRETKRERVASSEGGRGDGSRMVGTLDRIIDETERRWGSLLPQWVFNRIVFVAGFILLVLAFVFRGVTSIVLLVTGVIALMVGGASYTDDVMASKLLPGRTTPTHVLIVGIGLITLGILFGLIS